MKISRGRVATVVIAGSVLVTGATAMQKPRTATVQKLRLSSAHGPSDSAIGPLSHLQYDCALDSMATAQLLAELGAANGDIPLPAAFKRAYVAGETDGTIASLALLITDVKTNVVIPTPTGAISLYSARRT